MTKQDEYESMFDPDAQGRRCTDAEKEFLQCHRPRNRLILCTEFFQQNRMGKQIYWGSTVVPTPLDVPSQWNASDVCGLIKISASRMKLNNHMTHEKVAAEGCQGKQVISI